MSGRREAEDALESLAFEWRRRGSTRVGRPTCAAGRPRLVSGAPSVMWLSVALQGMQQCLYQTQCPNAVHGQLLRTAGTGSITTASVRCRLPVCPNCPSSRLSQIAKGKLYRDLAQGKQHCRSAAAWPLLAPGLDAPAAAVGRRQPGALKCSQLGLGAGSIGNKKCISLLCEHEQQWSDTTAQALLPHAGPVLLQEGGAHGQTANADVGVAGLPTQDLSQAYAQLLLQPCSQALLGLALPVDAEHRRLLLNC